MASAVRDRYGVVGLVALALFLSAVTGAIAYTHITNSVGHGLSNFLAGHEYVPLGWTDPPGTQYSTAEVRHYFDDGSYNVQCARARSGYVDRGGTWGSAPCQKRYVGGTDGLLSRHWVRRSGCPGTIHP